MENLNLLNSFKIRLTRNTLEHQLTELFLGGSPGGCGGGPLVLVFVRFVLLT